METRKTIRKWYWVWDFEKEEEWLNEMAQAGWVLDGSALPPIISGAVSPANIPCGWKCTQRMMNIFSL